MKQGKLFVFSAPSGSGKTTLVRHLLTQKIPLGFSISATSREVRGAEIEGIDYHFVSKQDFEKKINQKIELQRFRGNFYIEGLEAWEERKWIGKIIKINNISFKVEKNIPRCTAINLKPETDISDKSLLKSLKKSYDHFDMGVYLRSVDEGKIEVGNILEC